MVGISLILITVNVKAVLTSAIPSFTVTVIVAIPDCSAAGNNVNVKASPPAIVNMVYVFPPDALLNVIFSKLAGTTSALSLENTVTVSTSLSASATVKLIELVAVSSLVVTSLILVMVGIGQKGDVYDFMLLSARN